MIKEEGKFKWLEKGEGHPIILLHEVCTKIEQKNSRIKSSITTFLSWQLCDRMDLDDINAARETGKEDVKGNLCVLCNIEYFHK